MKKITFIFITSALLCACSSNPPKETEPAVNPNNLASNAPVDKPQAAQGAEEIDAMQKALEPSIEHALATLPKAKKRFLAGMKKGEAFYLTISLKEEKNIERVFILITKWVGEEISGKIANDINVLKAYKMGQEINFKESDVVDWTITNPDGSEEGNYIGKFIDAQRQ